VSVKRTRKRKKTRVPGACHPFPIPPPSPHHPEAADWPAGRAPRPSTARSPRAAWATPRGGAQPHATARLGGGGRAAAGRGRGYGRCHSGWRWKRSQSTHPRVGKIGSWPALCAAGRGGQRQHLDRAIGTLFVLCLCSLLRPADLAFFSHPLFFTRRRAPGESHPKGSQQPHETHACVLLIPCVCQPRLRKQVGAPTPGKAGLLRRARVVSRPRSPPPPAPPFSLPALLHTHTQTAATRHHGAPIPARPTR
jgi:hypothetical protein